ncbi:MAG: RluA family pseudouridine synthase [Myxococcota bacterium]
MTLLETVHRKFKMASVTRARKLIKNGFVTVNKTVVARPDTVVLSSDIIEIVEHAARHRKKANFEVLFEDDAILVAVKPAGILVEDFFKQVCEYIPLILTHRLDQKVSGVMIFAKSAEIERKLEANWHLNDKLYMALVEGVMPKPKGVIESWLLESAALKVHSVPANTPGAQKAVTHYRVIPAAPSKKQQKGDPTTRVEVSLETGRKNQIRVHLSELGCPIVGDEKYGAKTAVRGRIALHAFRLTFNHPLSGRRMTCSKETPF